MTCDSPHTYSLLEFNAVLRSAVAGAFPDKYWISAEISELHVNAAGHCYLELIEKDSRGATVARQRAMIWAAVYRLLKPYFEQETGYRLAAGIKVLVQVSVSFHELYGMSLAICDINPTYTLGDAARKRAEILRRLTEEGVAEMNRELPVPLVPQRIAVVSSGTAAGYGDFIDQLQNNPYRYIFYPVLFPAVMQGERTEISVIDALNRIYASADNFDCVVIIRGGGATSDLGSFDSYPLAVNVAQFPLPVIVGIGHDRDETVLDYVAAVRVKTPTAAAEWLVARAHETDLRIDALRRKAAEAVENRLAREVVRLQQSTAVLPLAVTHRLHAERARLLTAAASVERGSRTRLASEHSRIALLAQLIPERIKMRLTQECQRVEALQQTVDLLSPDALLARGYSLVLKAGKVVRSVEGLTEGDTVALLLADGEATATVTGTRHS